VILFYLLVAVFPLTTHHFWSSSLGELTIIKYLGGVCVLYALFYVFLKRRQVPSWFESWPARWFLLFYLIALVSYLIKGGNLPWEQGLLFTYTSFVLLFFVTLSVVDSPKRLDYTLLVGLGSVAFASLYLIREWQKYHATSLNFRPGWVLGDSNYYSLSAALCLPVGFLFLAGKRPLWQKSYCAACVLTTLIGDMLAASRGGFLALAAALLFIVFKSRKRGRNFVIALALLLPVLLLSPLSPLQRLLHPSVEDIGSVEIRYALWVAAVKMIKAYPLFGVGLGNFMTLAPAYSGGKVPEAIACNTFLEVAAEMGVPALLIFILMLYSGYRRLELMRRRITPGGSSQLADAVVALESSLVAYIVGSMTLSTEAQKTFWLMFFLSLCVAPFRSKARATQPLDFVPVPDAGTS
jgi:O-antigen ligase